MSGMTVLYGCFALKVQTIFIFDSPLANSNILASVWAFTSAGTDCLITTSLCVLLRKEIRGFSSATDDRITRCGVSSST